MEHKTLVTPASKDYELLDSGREEKLERFGDFVLARPDPQALWEKTSDEWKSADAVYTRRGEKGEWRGSVPNEWAIEFGGLKFLIRPTSFKHMGLFPEQLPNWDWMRETLTQNHSQKVLGSASPQPDHFAHDSAAASAAAPTVLNLFGYTGGASLAAVQAGAQVTHVDASKTAVTWARENAALSGLADAPIRWIVEDALVFVKREIKRGKRYDGIIMDPPAFGHGPKDELWKIEEHLLELIKLCGELLSDKPLFVLMNGYAAGYSPLVFAYNLQQFEQKFGGTIECGDLTIEQSSGKRSLPCGIFARWARG